MELTTRGLLHTEKRTVNLQWVSRLYATFLIVYLSLENRCKSR